MWIDECLDHGLRLTSEVVSVHSLVTSKKLLVDRFADILYVWQMVIIFILSWLFIFVLVMILWLSIATLFLFVLRLWRSFTSHEWSSYQMSFSFLWVLTPRCDCESLACVIVPPIGLWELSTRAAKKRLTGKYFLMLLTHFQNSLQKLF